MKKNFLASLMMVTAVLMCGAVVNAEITPLENGNFEYDGNVGAWMGQPSYWTKFGGTYDVGIVREFGWGVVPEDLGPGIDDAYWLCLQNSDVSTGAYQDLGTTTADGFYVAQMWVQAHVVASETPTQFKISFRNASDDTELAAAQNSNVIWVIPEALVPGPDSFPVLGEVTWQAGEATSLRFQIETTEITTDLRRMNFDDIRVENERLLAHNPSPNRWAVDVANGNVTLSWAAAEGVAAEGFNVYMGLDPNNLALLTATPLSSSTTSYVVNLPGDETIYFWRVDELTAGGTLKGMVWPFKMEAALPIINSVRGAFVNVGEDGLFSIDATNPLGADPLYYRWYYDPTPGTPGDEVALVDDTKYSGTTSAQMTLHDAEAADNKKAFYCVVTNLVGDTVSATVYMAFPGLVYHWSFEDVADEVHGLFPVVATTGTPTYDVGVVGKAVVFDGEDDAFEYGNVPLCFADGMPSANGCGSISLWARSADITKDWAGVIAKDAADCMWFGQHGTDGWLRYEQHHTSNSQIVFDIGSGTWVASEWLHFVMTYENQATKVYRNGELIFTRNTPYEPRDVGSRFFVGKIWWASTGTSGFFNGPVDELKIFNYPLSAQDVKMLYADEGGITVCLDSPTDIVKDNNCTTDLADFAALSAEWLQVHTYPAAP